MQTTTPAAPFQLLDQWDNHLKFNGRAPRTLEEISAAHADYLHARRLAEIKSLRAKLALLDPFLRPLHDLGVRLARRDMSTWDHGKTLRIMPAICTCDDKLHAALVELGFREIEREYAGSKEDRVKMKHGRSLIVVINVTKAAVSPAPAAPATQSQVVTP